MKMPKTLFFLYDRPLADQTGAAANTAVPERSSVPAAYQWKLEDLFESHDAWQDEAVKLEQHLAELVAYQGQLSKPAALLACLKKRDEIGISSGQLYAYARMHRDEDAALPVYQAMTGKIEALMAKTGAAAAFIEPELLALPEETLQQYITEQDAFADYRFYLTDLLRQKPHVLSPKEEELLSRAAEPLQAAETIFSMLAQADMKFPATLGEDGQQVSLSEGRYGSLIRSPQREVRKQAFTNLLGTYKNYRNTLAAALTGNIKKNIFLAHSRGYDSARAAALESDNVPLTVYDNLIATVEQHLEPLHAYSTLKAKALEVDSLHMYDLYVPLVENVSFHIPYEEGCRLVQTGLAPLGSEYQAMLAHSFTSGWIDVYENRGKRSGAYSWGTYGSHPFVLLNYNNRYDDVSTLAHEMGHALHSYYSHKQQPYASASYTIFCAEVASTTNEVLLLDYMLAATKDQKKRMYLLNQYLEQARTTVYRQTMFAEFEKMMYQTVEAGDTLTADFLDQQWHALNAKYYGPQTTIDADIDTEWARIPHFYWNFYVYQYATGYSAASTLAEKLVQHEPSAVDNYLRFLQSGGSDYSLNLLQAAGVDMSSPAPIAITLEKFAQRVKELQDLLRIS